MSSRTNKFISFVIFSLLVSQLSCYMLEEALPGSSLIEDPQYSLLSVLKRKTKIYTQGIFFRNNSPSGSQQLIESGGLYSKSTLTIMKYPSQEVISQVKLRDKYFAEGIVQVGDFLYQLTWQERTIIRYNLNNLKEQKEFKMDPQMKEGWGLSDYINDTLIATDGSDKIYFLNPVDMKVKRKLNITYDGKPVMFLNEIRYVNQNEALCNIYLTQKIARINLTTGKVVKMYDMSKIIDYEVNHQGNTYDNIENGECLNGIAIPDKSNRNRVILTGKLWSHFYEVEFK